MKLVLLLALVALVGVAGFAWFVLSRAHREAEATSQEARAAMNAPRDVEDVSGDIVERFGPELPRKPATHPIRRYRVQLPSCPFEEIAEIRAVVFDNGREDEVRGLLRKKIDELARSVGGDAVGSEYEFSTTRVIGGMGNPAIGEKYRHLTATVLRFTDPNCVE